ncbi:MULTISPECIES: histidinol dehydrogenase [unclassified Hyphomonas]|jgi:histidinol dehydrogenase|uniref:Histidinol dehydrogenase n=5 Tax=root TaxID=1 RepID=A0A160TXI4_9ZZZZ|nr:MULTISPECIES: histidinol dehydrogenase [unclassified Hyphomonas]MAL44424.1 histidinol dehydrogenase [Hyphomonas sp.]HBT36005.1 histidinol dehydrogenase [Hyphomonas sp.]HBX93205.1 histidinol dehydrogenase [Hyphomonas sp.]|tara:strand:- start:4653 stop:5957 length:1305 start_codon:yes stop_codon:yes gene_type:complete
MVRRFFASNDAFNGEFAQFLEQERGTGEDVANTVTGILKDVQARGGEAVAEYTARFDGLQLDPSTLTSDNVNLHSLAAQCPADLREAIDFAHDRIATYHAAQRPADHSFTDSAGVELGWRWTALESVGVYVPGGRASYPSSVLMNVVPAKIAGVERIVMVAPAPQGELSPAVAYAALKAGVEEFYPIGGAQAVGALAFGTSNMAPVDKIVGPGNAFVAEAKRQVFGRVGIDTIAGPSEILVIADHTANPDWIAADLLSQAEHDPSSQSILIVVDQAVGDSVEGAVENQLKTLPTGERARESWMNNGAIVVAPDLPAAASIANRIAAEHLELAVEDPDALLPLIRHAGAVFLGHYTPEALGDYVTGSNHVLPTSRAARFSSGLGLYDFLKRMSVQRVGPEGFAAIAPAALRLAEAERLPAHARSISIRSNQGTDG